MKRAKKITETDIIDFFFEDEILFIALESEENYREYKTSRFWAWFEAKYPCICSDYMVEEQFNVEDYYYNEDVIDYDLLKDDLTNEYMAEFISHINLSEEMINGGWQQVIKDIKALKAA